MATVALNNLACPNHIKGPYLHEDLLLNQKIGQCLSPICSKNSAGAAASPRSLHTFERGVRILGLELIKRGFDFLKSRLRFLLVPFVTALCRSVIALSNCFNAAVIFDPLSPLNVLLCCFSVLIGARIFMLGS